MFKNVCTFSAQIDCAAAKKLPMTMQTAQQNAMSKSEADFAAQHDPANIDHGMGVCFIRSFKAYSNI